MGLPNRFTAPNTGKERTPEVKHSFYLDVELLAAVIRNVSEAALDDGIPPGAAAQARVIAILYERLFSSGGRIDRGLVQKYLKLSN
jgi:hypothetical protein